MMNSYTWNYRVIEFLDPRTTQPWRAIHEVHYINDIPVSYSENPASIVFDNDDDPDEIKNLIERMKEAIDKPVLVEKDFYK